MEYTVLEKEHERILAQMTAMCRSNGDTFTVDDRIQVIRKEMENTGYKEISPEDSIFSMWALSGIENLPDNIVLISTHADIVPSISQCSSTLREDGFYSGTYDNIGTNAAAVILMKEFSMPSNVVFAFTGDEETGRCNGAKQAANYLTTMGKKLTCIALDVTYEGFYQNRLCSIENCTAPKIIEESFLNKVARTATLVENEQQSFCFVKAGAKHIPTELDEKYLSPSTGMYDEAFAYRDEGYPALSFCLPCSGSMHSNAGVVVKQPVFEGYLISLASFIYEFTKTYPQLTTVYKKLKDDLVEKAKQIELSKPKYESFTSMNWYDMADYKDDYEDDSSAEDWYIESLSPIMEELYAKAVIYDANTIDEFVRNTEIPAEYLKDFYLDPDGELLPEEQERIDKFLRGIFMDVHNNYEESIEDALEEDDYYISWCNKLAEERLSLLDEDDREYASIY